MAPVATFPLQLVAVDVYKYQQVPYLTVVDHYSSYPVLFKLEEATIQQQVMVALNLYVSMFYVWVSTDAFI